MYAATAGGFMDRSLGEKLFLKLPEKLGQKIRERSFPTRSNQRRGVNFEKIYIFLYLSSLIRHEAVNLHMTL